MWPRPVLLGLLLLLSPLAACTPAPRQPALELTLHDRTVTCDAASGRCVAGGEVAVGEGHRVALQLDPRSRYGANGFHARVALWRAGGVVGRLELDIPVGPLPAPAVAPPTVSYVERRQGRPVFNATQLSARIELGADDACPCQTGRLELLLIDAGADGVLGTADDQQRRITRARLRLDDRPFCHAAAVLPLREGLIVVGTRGCPVATGGAARPGTTAWTGGGGGIAASGWNDDGWYDEDWSGDPTPAGQDPWNTEDPWDGEPQPSGDTAPVDDGDPDGAAQPGGVDDGTAPADDPVDDGGDDGSDDGSWLDDLWSDADDEEP